jgi:AAA15 family ATPase/GTPase
MMELPFTQIEIDGFRGLRSLNLEGLGCVNVLVGNNNSGKTSVLEAISILCQPQNLSEWISVIRRRDFGRLDETIIQSLRWCFTRATLADYETLAKADCRFKCDGNFPLRKLSVKYSEFMKERRIDRFDDDSASELVRGSELTYFGEYLQQNSTELVSTSKRLKISEDTPSIIFPYNRKRLDYVNINSETLTPYSYQLNRTQLKSQSNQLFNDNAISELLKDFDQDVEAIRIGSFSGNKAAIYIKHRKLGEAPLSVFGDGMRRAVLLTTTLLSLKRGGVLLLDEIEAGIHVSALEKVFNWLVKTAKNIGIQIFITTHSLEALDAIISANPEQNENDIVVFHLNQTEEKTQCKRFSGDLLHRLRSERGLDLR